MWKSYDILAIYYALARSARCHFKADSADATSLTFQGLQESV